jgi:hypothetical protein
LMPRLRMRLYREILATSNVSHPLRPAILSGHPKAH